MSSANGKRGRSQEAAAINGDHTSSSGSSASESDEVSGPFVQLSTADVYFEAHSKAAKTSDQRFSAQVDEPFTPASYLDALPVEIAMPLVEAYDSRFALWRAELQAGFSLCFFGRGSKKALLERFAQLSLVCVGDVVVVNGYVPGLSLSDVLDAIEKQVLQGAGPAPYGEGDRTEQRIRAVCEHYADDETGRSLFLMVHNIEGAALRSVKIRGLLAMLASTPHIHLVASFDHFRTPLLFPTKLATGRPPFDADEDEDEDVLLETRIFNFTYHHTPTHLAYTYEPVIAGVPAAIFDPAVFAPSTGKGASRGSAAQRVAGAISVLSSLGRDQHDLFVFLSDQQRTANGEATALARLQDRFQLINPERFDGLLRELYDHEILEKQHDSLRVMLSKDEIERVLDHAVLAAAVGRVLQDGA